MHIGGLVKNAITIEVVELIARMGLEERTSSLGADKARPTLTFNNGYAEWAAKLYA
jgi:hypothetical protein